MQTQDQGGIVWNKDTGSLFFVGNWNVLRSEFRVWNIIGVMRSWNLSQVQLSVAWRNFGLEKSVHKQKEG
jgi:hypothetical protein